MEVAGEQPRADMDAGAGMKEIALAAPARARSAAIPDSIASTIFNFFLSDIVGLSFDSNSTKRGVSRYIGTNGGLQRDRGRQLESHEDSHSARKEDGHSPNRGYLEASPSVREGG
jgi:hypothetical protein